MQELEAERAEAARRDASRERRLAEQSTLAENRRNELIALRHDLGALDAQLHREREKLAKERDANKELVDKVGDRDRDSHLKGRTFYLRSTFDHSLSAQRSDNHQTYALLSR